MNDNSKFYTDMELDEKIASLDFYRSVERGLQAAIGLLFARKANFATVESELKLIRIELADKEADLVKVRARRLAFEESGFAMLPPSPDVVDTIKAQADVLDQMIAEAETADTIVDAVVLLIKTWKDVENQ